MHRQGVGWHLRYRSESGRPAAWRSDTLFADAASCVPFDPGTDGDGTGTAVSVSCVIVEAFPVGIRRAGTGRRSGGNPPLSPKSRHKRPSENIPVLSRLLRTVPEEDRNGDGVVNGYARCGVRCGEEPTSGDIQTQHGCEQGYITGVACEPYIG